MKSTILLDMDIFNIYLYGLLYVITIMVCSILPILSFFLYKYLRQKSKFLKNISLGIFIITTIGMIFLAIKSIFGPSGFGPEYETVIINQNIGGKLLCKSVYNADIHSWDYQIDYQYISKFGDTIDIGGGSYHGKNWDKDEQLKKLGDWLILRTGSWHDTARLILKNTDTDSVRVYDLDNHDLSKDSTLIPEYNKSNEHICCDESCIEHIKKDEITVRYIHKNYDRVIKYKIDKETGYLIVKEIEIE